MPLPLKKIGWHHIILFLIVIAPFFYFAIGLRYQDIASDAASYAGYATSLASGHGYTFTDAAFTNLREPGYPLFLAMIFVLFGIGNYTAVYIVQSFLLGLLGLIISLIFAKFGYKKIGYFGGFLIGLLPSFGLYTHTVGSELLFAVLLGLIFYFCVKIVLAEQDLPHRYYALLGFIFGFTSLVRVQLLFFIFILGGCYLLFFHKSVYRIVSKIALMCVVFLMVVSSWVAVVHHYTGHYSITEGRQGLSYYIRADRAEMSYKDLSKYTYEWFKRSLTGGEFDEFLYSHEYNKLGLEYWSKATNPESTKAVTQESISRIKNNLGHFAYGNIIEIAKTLYIEHDYSNTINKYVRAAMYLVVYGLFIIGVFFLVKTRKNLAYRSERILAGISALAITYNLIILSSFDSIPRYNTPYLPFFIIIGLSGIAIYSKQREEKKGTTAKLF